MQRVNIEYDPVLFENGEHRADGLCYQFEKSLKYCQLSEDR